MTTNSLELACKHSVLKNTLRNSSKPCRLNEVLSSAFNLILKGKKKHQITLAFITKLKNKKQNNNNNKKQNKKKIPPHPKKKQNKTKKQQKKTKQNKTKKKKKKQNKAQPPKKKKQKQNETKKKQQKTKKTHTRTHTHKKKNRSLSSKISCLYRKLVIDSLRFFIIYPLFLVYRFRFVSIKAKISDPDLTFKYLKC